MSGFLVQAAALGRLDQIHRYTAQQWGAAQADAYIRSLFDRFARIAAREQPWRRIPAEFGIDGFMCRHERHLIYWRVLDDGMVGIVTVLHERMHAIARLRDDYA